MSTIEGDSPTAVLPDDIVITSPQAEQDADLNFSVMDLDTSPKMSSEEIIVHLIKSNIGAGLLSLPYAFMKGGLLSCFLLFWIIGALNLYCMHSLIRLYRYHRPRLARLKLDYGDVVRFTLETVPLTKSYSKSGKYIVDSFIILSQLGFCCVYFVFVPIHLNELLLSIVYIPVHLLIFLMFILLIPLVCIRSLRVLAPISLIANVFVLSSLLIVFQYIIRNPLPIKTLPMISSSFGDLVFCISTVVYTFEGICFVLPMLQKTDNIPLFTHYFGVLNTSVSICSIIFFTVGFYGFVRFGINVKTSIALNLPSDALYICTKALFVIAVFFTYPLQFYLPCSILWPRIQRRFLYEFSEERKQILELVWRVALMGSTGILASLIPNIGLVISLIGAFCCTCLALVFPPILEIMSFLSFGNAGKYYHRLILDIIVLLFGLMVFIFGTFNSLVQIFKCVIYPGSKECRD
ncbi:hypothetical protein GJ496_004716 [Pomphorhynchus laevis]|nr:hypothetical protein GJ496_004716 [Pomphorhynchus laevis]